MGQGDFVLEYPKLPRTCRQRKSRHSQPARFHGRLNPEPQSPRLFEALHARTGPRILALAATKVSPRSTLQQLPLAGRASTNTTTGRPAAFSGHGCPPPFYYPAISMMLCRLPHGRSSPQKTKAISTATSHSHRFPWRQTPARARRQRRFRSTRSQPVNSSKTAQLSVDIFAVSHGLQERIREKNCRLSQGKNSPHTFAVGERSGHFPLRRGPRLAKRVPITAPLGTAVDAAVRRGRRRPR